MGFALFGDEVEYSSHEYYDDSKPLHTIDRMTEPEYADDN